MIRIKDQSQYEATSKRIEELLAMLSNEKPADAFILNELDLLGNLLADYEAGGG